jgi:hypothetical protein
MTSAFALHSSILPMCIRLWILLLCIFPFVLTGQQVILNTKGERIVVYPDGSWRYYERGDSALLSTNLLKEEILPTEEKPTESIERISSDPVADKDASSLANRFTERIRADVQEAQHNLAKKIEDKFEAEARLNQARENRKLIEPDLIARLDEDYEKLTEEVKSARKHQNWIGKMQVKAEKMLAMPVTEKPRSLNKLITDYDAYFARTGIPVQDQFPMANATKKNIADQPGSKTTPVQKEVTQPPHIAVTGDGSYRRAPVPCRIVQNSRSAIAVEKQLLFTHTDEDLRPYFRQQELVTCYASLMQIEDNLYLSLEFQIASPDARKNFGILEHNSMLRLKLMDESFINLFNTRSDQGKIDAYTGYTIYTGNYLVDRESEKKLSKTELDKLRIVWTSGFEDYDVVNLDFLVNQFACLRAQKM